MRCFRLAYTYLVRIREFEFPTVSCPADKVLAGLVREQLEQELPQLDGAGALVCGHDVGWEQGQGVGRIAAAVALEKQKINV